MKENLTMHGAITYFQAEHGITVSNVTIVKWIKNGLLDGKQDKHGRRMWSITREAIDEAVAKAAVPPKVGRKRTYTREQRATMVEMRSKKHSIREIAAYFGCDESYVSLVTRGLR